VLPGPIQVARDQDDPDLAAVAMQIQGRVYRGEVLALRGAWVEAEGDAPRPRTAAFP
jgi:hypothetical protein